MTVTNQTVCVRGKIKEALLLYCTTFKAIKESVRNGTDRNVGDSSYNNWGMIDRLQVDSSG